MREKNPFKTMNEKMDKYFEKERLMVGSPSPFVNFVMIASLVMGFVIFVLLLLIFMRAFNISLFADFETIRLKEEQYESRFLGRTPSLDRIECVGGIAYIHTASGGVLVGGQDIYAPVLTGDGKPMTCEEYQTRFPRKKE